MNDDISVLAQAPELTGRERVDDILLLHAWSHESMAHRKYLRARISIGKCALS